MIATINYLLGAEATINSSGTTFNGATVVRVYNQTGSDVVVTVKASGGAVTGSMTVKGGDTVYVQKGPSENISAASGVKMVPVGF